MLIYFIMYLILMIVWAAYYFYGENVVLKRVCTVISWLEMVCLFVLRHDSMGIDLQYNTNNGYLGAYEVFGEMSIKDILWGEYWNRDFEKGYILFNKLLSYISKSRHMLLIGVAIVTMTLFFIVLYKYSDDIFMSVIVFIGTPCFVALFSTLRQMIAVMICFLSFIFVFKKKPIPFILMVILAFFFHNTSLIFLLAYPLYRLNITKTGRIVSVVLIGVIFILRKQLFFLAKIVDPTAEMVETGAYTLFLIFCAIYIVCSIFGDYEDKHFGGLMNIFWGACVIMAFSSLHTIAERLAWYFIMALVLLVPIFINYQKKISLLNYRIFYWGILLCFIGAGLYQIYTTTWAMAYPYYFLWEEVPISK